jgi:predicted enzyme related to lactoylglutathione lyase
MTNTNVGRLVWYELFANDPAVAIAFYTEVVGWKTQGWDEDKSYTMFAGDQGPLGGCTQMPERPKAMGVPPYWQANVEVANVDESVAKVKELGGTVYLVEDAPKVGRFAIVADPQGAVIALFKPAIELASHDTSKSGEFSWHELYTTDHEAAFEFYRQIAGWERMGSMDMGGEMGTYLLWGRDGKQLGGMLTLPKGMKTPSGADVPPSWMYYVTVADFDAALDRAKAKGATVLNGPMPVPGGQRIVQLMDPQGAAFALASAP